jgi:hypothetical protein
VQDVRLLVDGMRADGPKARVAKHSHTTLRAEVERRHAAGPRSIVSTTS